jgi:hypothetical protein
MVTSVDGNSRNVVKKTSSGIESGNGSNLKYGSSDDNNSVDTSNSLTGTSQHERQEKRNRRRAQKRQERNQRKQRVAKELGSSNRPFSIIWTVLTVGVVLSFVDVIYIMKHIDSDPSSPATFHQQQQQHQQSIAPFVENQKAQHEGIDGSNNNNNNKNEKNPYLDVKARLAAKGPIIDLITEAGISFDPVEDADLLDELPDWDEVVKMYGAKPVIHGINEGNCQKFQQHSDRGEHLLGTAGTFNSGTNLMAELLIHNCMMPERMKKYGSKNRGIRWQVSLLCNIFDLIVVAPKVANSR